MSLIITLKAHGSFIVVGMVLASPIIGEMVGFDIGERGLNTEEEWTQNGMGKKGKRTKGIEEENSVFALFT